MSEGAEDLYSAIQAQTEELREVRRLLQEISHGNTGIIQTLRHENRLLMTQVRVQRLSNDIMEFWYEGELIRLFVPDADTDLIQRDVVMWKTFFEVELLERIRKRYGLAGASIVDAGANIGNHTVYFSKACGAKSIVAFEPNPPVADVLERNVRLNNLPGVTVIKEGLADQESFIYISVQSATNLGGTMFSDQPSGRGFRCRTLDSLALTEVDFMKIDVEGMGGKVLAGAREILSQHRPAVMIESFSYEFEETSRIFSAHGYQMVDTLAQDNYLFEYKG